MIHDVMLVTAWVGVATLGLMGFCRILGRVEDHFNPEASGHPRKLTTSSAATSRSEPVAWKP